MAENFGGEFILADWQFLKAIRQYLIRQKLHSVMSSLLQTLSFNVY